MRTLLSASIALTLASAVHAANPQVIQQGQQLFIQPFSATAPGPGGDGLGPLFNHVSCAACHHSGGIGGAGDHRFNARSFAVSKLTFDGSKTRQKLDEAIASVNPLLRGPGGELVSIVPMHRYGGTPRMDQLRRATIGRFNADWDDDSRINSDLIRAEAIGQVLSDSGGSLQMHARIFSRNTTPLFGLGLVDRIPDSLLIQQVKAQKRHPEINGRPATLVDGRFGKFGWRGNFATLLEFTETACVNELGLQTKRVLQTPDPTLPQYQNPNPDIDDPSIKAMTSFIAALPQPTRAAPQDSLHAQQMQLGEQRFASVGCAVCHVPDLGPAKGIFSDLLLHDMGPSSVDYNTAPPYRKSYEPDYEEDILVSSGYYGGTPVMMSPRTMERGPQRVFVFESPERPPRTVTEAVRFGGAAEPIAIQGPAVFRGINVPAGRALRLRTAVRSETIPTNFAQEWRTPPLWGLRDSAPYMHDGRAETILEAVSMHEGEAAGTRDRFYTLPYDEQLAVLAFLESLIAPTSGVIPPPKDFTDRSMAAY